MRRSSGHGTIDRRRSEGTVTAGTSVVAACAAPVRARHRTRDPVPCRRAGLVPPSGARARRPRRPANWTPAAGAHRGEATLAAGHPCCAALSVGCPFSQPPARKSGVRAGLRTGRRRHAPRSSARDRAWATGRPARGDGPQRGRQSPMALAAARARLGPTGRGRCRRARPSTTPASSDASAAEPNRQGRRSLGWDAPCSAPTRRGLTPSSIEALSL
jgi:hypothetical protein